MHCGRVHETWKVGRRLSHNGGLGCGECPRLELPAGFGAFNFNGSTLISSLTPYTSPHHSPSIPLLSKAMVVQYEVFGRKVGSHVVRTHSSILYDNQPILSLLKLGDACLRHLLTLGFFIACHAHPRHYSSNSHVLHGREESGEDKGSIHQCYK